MIEFNTVPKISIDLRPGLYLLTPLSATGKTYLASVLQQLHNLGESVVAYTYTDFQKHVDLDRLVTERGCSVLLLDRYGMYNGDESIVRVALRVAKQGVVLIDVKAADVPGIPGCRYADITLSPDRIEVSE